MTGLLASEASDPMPLGAAWGLGLVLLFAGGLLAYVAYQAKNGLLHRNHLVGIRTSKTMASDEAWMAAHRAAAPWMGVAALGSLLPGALLLFRPANGTGMVVVLAGLGVMVGFVAVSAAFANQAASEAD